MSQHKLGEGNPYWSLLKIAWKYAAKQKKRFIFIYTMFFLSNLINALVPLFWGWFINEVQMNGTNILKNAWLYVGIYASLHFIAWALHGRLTENSNKKLHEI